MAENQVIERNQDRIGEVMSYLLYEAVFENREGFDDLTDTFAKIMDEYETEIRRLQDQVAAVNK